MPQSETFSLEQQRMDDAKLVELAKKEVSKLCETGGRSLTMCVPPRVTDTDMLLCELIRRFEVLSQGVRTEDDENPDQDSAPYTPCDYKKDTVTPCDFCPRRITAYHMCKLLQECNGQLKEDEE